MVTVIAIDGPAGSGKSSVSKEVARRLGFGYLDTGAAYRALAWAVQNGKLGLDDFTGFDYSISMNPDEAQVFSFGVNVTKEIRETAVAEYVSQVAKNLQVRAWMKSYTRDLVLNSKYSGVVVEGRDITTVVFPDAKFRILLTASELVRLERRAKEMDAAELQEMRKQITERDASDSKVVDFMNPAEGVDLVDTTNLNFEESVNAVLKIVKEV